jgi:hypothetical protein
MAATVREQLGDGTLFEKDTMTSGQYECVACGYGIVIHAVLPSCPMCHGELWTRARWNPLSRSFEIDD